MIAARPPSLNPAFDAEAWLRQQAEVARPDDLVPPGPGIDWGLWGVMLAVAFGLGSIPFGLLVARAKGINIREHGSGNIGATNVGRVLGGRYFAIVFTLDMLKGLVPTLGAGLILGWTGLGLGGEPAPGTGFALAPLPGLLWLVIMTATVLGHMFTPFAGFRGGKGVATGLGALLGLYPVLTVPGAGALAVFLVSLGLWRFVGLASVLAAVSLPLWVWLVFGSVERLFGGGGLRVAMWPWLLVTVLLAALVTYKHRENLARVAAGTEPRVGVRRPPG